MDEHCKYAISNKIINNYENIKNCLAFLIKFQNRCLLINACEKKREIPILR